MKSKKFKKRTLLCVIMALVIVMGSTSVVSADALISEVAVVRKSNTLAIVSAFAEYERRASKANIRLVLQEKYNDTWRNATGIPYNMVQKWGYNVDDLYLADEYILEKGKVYRIAASFFDTTDGIDYNSELISATF